ncbi:uncharacterized protein LOC134266856 [Saccostrea cucullata]|uniref:uncharacterized protein LOC134266856 n=1 Tax=Saccostrea cuccullata TaxID=36930 RepID=UPI002ED223AA
MLGQAFLLAAAVLMTSAQQQGLIDRTLGAPLGTLGGGGSSNSGNTGGGSMMDPYGMSDRAIGRFSDPNSLQNRQGNTRQSGRNPLSSLEGPTGRLGQLPGLSGRTGLLGGNQRSRSDPFYMGDGMMRGQDSRRFGFDGDRMGQQRRFIGGSPNDFGMGRDRFDTTQGDGMSDMLRRGGRLSDSTNQQDGSQAETNDFLSDFLRGRPFTGDNSLIDANVLASETNYNDFRRRGRGSRESPGLLSQTTSSLLPDGVTNLLPGGLTENLPLGLLRDGRLLDLNILSRRRNYNDFRRPRTPSQSRSSRRSGRFSSDNYNDRFPYDRNRFLDGMTGFPRRGEGQNRRSSQFMNSMNDPQRRFDMMRSMPQMRSPGMRQDQGRFTDRMSGRGMDRMMQNTEPRFQTSGTQERALRERPTGTNQIGGTATPGASGTGSGGTLNVI